MQEEQKTRKKAVLTGKRKAVLLIAAAFLLVVLNIAAFGMIYINSKLNLIDYVSSDDWYASGSDAADGILQPEVEWLESPDNIHKDRSVFNILLLGTDERTQELSENARSDAIMVLSLNKKENTIKLVSFERGMNVMMPNGKVHALTNLFRFGGPQWVLWSIQYHFELDVDKYVRVNFSVFEKLVDAIGGVDIELTWKEVQALNGDVVTNTLPLSRRLSKGPNHLDGYETLQYCRLRFIDSDWVRIERQRKTIAAIKEQCRDMSLTELDNALNEVLPMIQTNLDKQDLISLALSLPRYLDAEMEDMTIPAKNTFEKLSYGYVNFEANAKILQEFFYGSEEPETVEE